jgi:ABC-type glutathione transport system ATPase component
MSKPGGAPSSGISNCGLVRGSDLLDGNEVSVARTAIAHAGGVGFRRLTAMIVVTHELGFAREACDTLVFMDAGRIIEQGSPAEVIDAPHHERTREFMKRVRH